MRWAVASLFTLASIYFLSRRGQTRSRAAARRAIEKHLPDGADAERQAWPVRHVVDGLAAACRLLEARLQKRGEADQGDLLVSSLTVYMRCGIPFDEALSLCAGDLRPPVSDHLRRYASEAGLETEPGGALAELVQALDNSDFELVSLAAVTSRETGSDIRSVIGAVGEAARERAAIRRELRTQTVQGRMSGRIVAGLPLVFLGLSCAVSRGTIAALLGSIPGFVMLAAAAALNTLGFIWIRKILDIET